MGCCASTSKKDLPLQSRAPPPPPFLEEETVKEVLSETPNPKPSFPEIEEGEKREAKNWGVLRNANDESDKKALILPNPEEASEVSEICSLSDLSTTTATLTDRRDDDDEVRRGVDRSPAKFRNRSFSGELGARRDRVLGGRSPARRGDPSPGRVRMVPGRDWRGSLTDGGQRRDAGENSGRRSRSPATRAGEGGPKPGLGRCPSSRRTGRSPGRVGSEQADKTRKVEEGKWPPPPTTNESLENPLVSLECFIFL